MLFLLSASVIHFLAAAHDILTQCPTLPLRPTQLTVCEERDCHLLYDVKHYTLLTTRTILFC